MEVVVRPNILPTVKELWDVKLVIAIKEDLSDHLGIILSEMYGITKGWILNLRILIRHTQITYHGVLIQNSKVNHNFTIKEHLSIWPIQMLKHAFNYYYYIYFENFILHLPLSVAGCIGQCINAWIIDSKYYFFWFGFGHSTVLSLYYSNVIIY